MPSTLLWNYTRRAVRAAVVASMLWLGASPGLDAQDVPRISLQDALTLIEAAQKDAAAKNYRLSFAVVDQRGDLIAVARMPGAGAATPDTAIGKAMLSAIYGQPSAALVARQTNPVTQAMNESTGGRFRFLQGALPIVRGGFTVGAIAASGATSQQDEDAVRAALSAVNLR
jgi:glc operon protein GlcG